MKRYFGNSHRLKTHARCWTHVIVFAVELVTTRNPMVLFHFGCNVAWQFCTPTTSKGLPRDLRRSCRRRRHPRGAVPARAAEMVRREVALTLGCAAAVALLGVGLPNLATQSVGFAVVLDTHRAAAPMLGADAAVAINDALRVFLLGVACFLSSKIGTARDIAFLGDLTDAMRARHTGPLRRAAGLRGHVRSVARVLHGDARGRPALGGRVRDAALAVLCTARARITVGLEPPPHVLVCPRKPARAGHPAGRCARGANHAVI